MRLPLVRFTLRWMMAAVAIAALAAGAMRMGRRSPEYREAAEEHAICEDFYRLALANESRMDDPSYPATCRARLDYHRIMREKYEFAARYPWLPVAPDPPESK